MYNGLDKYGGSVVGGSEGGSDLGTVLRTSSAEETVVAHADLGNGEQEILLAARINPRSGGLMWEQQADAEATHRMVIAHSQMTSMMHDKSRNSKYDAAIKCVC